VTAFPSPSAKLVEPKWWGELLGGEPDSRNLRPSRGEMSEQGTYDKGTLSLNISPLRIDWRLDIAMDSQMDEVIPSLGAFQEVGDKFCKLMTEWVNLPSTTTIQRLAFGAIMHQPVGSREEGYRLLSGYLPSVDLSSESRDFLYQINRPRRSRVPDMTEQMINRLTKWGCVSLQRSLFQYQPDGITKASELGETTYACFLELDMSTPADFKGEIPQEALANLLREQFEFGKEIASKGDIV